MKIINKTSKQNLSMMDCKIWEIDILQELIKKYAINDTLTINNDLVNEYNKLAKQDKSNNSFVNQIKKLIKNGVIK